MLSLFVVHRATENSTHFLISTPLNSCGTLVNETEDALIFWNEIRADAVIIDNVITRTHDIKFKFYCSYSRRKMLSIQFQPQHIFIGSEGTWIMLSSFFFLKKKILTLEILDLTFSLHLALVCPMPTIVIRSVWVRCFALEDITSRSTVFQSA